MDRSSRASSVVERLGFLPSILHKFRHTSGEIVTHDIYPCKRSSTIVDGNRRSSYRQAVSAVNGLMAQPPLLPLLLRLRLHIARPSKSSVVDNSPCAMPCRCMNARAQRQISGSTTPVAFQPLDSRNKSILFAICRPAEKRLLFSV